MISSRKALPMRRYLLFDSGCSVCSELARNVEYQSKGRLSAQSLGDLKVQEWLEQAKPGWQWEPTLLELEERRARAFTGVSLRVQLLRVLGLRRSWQVARLVARIHRAPVSGGMTRKGFFKQAGAALAGVTGLGAFGASPAAAAAARGRSKPIENSLGPYARREGVKAYSEMEKAGAAIRLPFTHAQPARSGTLVSHETFDSQTSFRLVRNGDTIVKVDFDKANHLYDVEDSAGRNARFVFTEQGVNPESAAVVEYNRDDLTLAAAIQHDLEMLMAPAIPDRQVQTQDCACRVSIEVRGTGQGASRSGACQNATNDANLNCSNCSCIGCCSWRVGGCDCICGVGDYFCNCGRTGHPCFWNCLPSCN